MAGIVLAVPAGTVITIRTIVAAGAGVAVGTVGTATTTMTAMIATMTEKTTRRDIAATAVTGRGATVGRTGLTELGPRHLLLPMKI